MKRIIILISTMLLLAACGVLGSGSKGSPIKIQDTFYKVKFGTSKNSVKYDTFPVYGGDFGGFVWTGVIALYTSDSNSGKFYQVIFANDNGSQALYESLYNTLKRKYGPLEINSSSTSTTLRRVFSDGTVECSVMYALDKKTLWLEYHNINLKGKADARQFNEL